MQPLENHVDLPKQEYVPGKFFVHSEVIRYMQTGVLSYDM